MANSYVALLYSVVLGKGKRVIMSDLRELAEELGLDKPRTVVATGNLIFETATRSTPAALTRRLESAFAERFGRHVDIIVRNAAAWRQLIAGNPFPGESIHHASHVTVRVMRSAPSGAALDRLQTFRRGDEQIRPVGRDIWVYFPHGIAKSKLASALGTDRSGAVGTVRNWNTLRRIAVQLPD